MVLGKAHKVRDFRLVLCAEVCGAVVECSTKVLELHVEAHRPGKLRSLLSESSIISTEPCIGYMPG
jgi:hypothetical protein